jgi:hypothetical protein
VRRIFTNHFHAFAATRPVQAAEFSLPTAPAEEGMEPDDLLCSRNARPQKDGEGRPGALFARRGPAIRRRSLDARSVCERQVLQPNIHSKKREPRFAARGVPPLESAASPASSG